MITEPGDPFRGLAIFVRIKHCFYARFPYILRYGRLGSLENNSGWLGRPWLASPAFPGIVFFFSVVLRLFIFFVLFSVFFFPGLYAGLLCSLSSLLLMSFLFCSGFAVLVFPLFRRLVGAAFDVRVLNKVNLC